ncbi:MAG: putative DNA binding domain-containing protein [Bacteroidaceae bacterium]|nr:putative DNA binding domain-containing protein [Bacteroidaceae bacterium]
MTIEQIQTRQECQTFECKSIHIDPKALAIPIVAMANADGGVLAIGISDKTRKVEGVDANTERLNELLRVPFDFCIPSVRVRCEYITCVDDKGKENRVLLMHIPASIQLHTNQADECYMRVGDKSKRLNFDERMQLLYDKGERYYEDEGVRGATINDIDMDLVIDYIRIIGYGKSAIEYLKENNDFVTETGGQQEISTACILLFGKNPQRFFPRARTRFIRYEGTDERVGTEMNVIKDVTFEGTILNQIRETVSYLETQVREHTYLGQDGRFATNRNYPKFALQELVVNGCCHRAYNIKGTETQIKMFDDRIVFETPGKLPGLVCPENIRHTHFSRNPKIAQYLKAYKYVKEFGEGIDRICSDLESRGSAIPTFCANTFILKATLMAEWTSDKEHNSPSTAQVPPKYRPSTAQVEKLVAVMGDGFVGIQEIMRLCGIVRRKTIQESYIKPALADGSVVRKYPDQPKRPDQMYRITDSAREWKKKNSSYQ